MNKTSQFSVALLALGALLSGVASHATDVAALPLKASVLAKPNVIFGLDDSGSMDSEVLLPNNDGAFWWDTIAASGWDATGRTWFNAAGASGAQWKKMVYLLPNGTGTGNRAYSDAANDHFAIPPTAQFAFLRSAAYNPLYYNPAITYRPWAPGQAAGSPYGNASLTAAKSHPTYGTGTFDLTADRTDTATNWTFMALPGMLVPGTAQVCTGACGAWNTPVALLWTESPAGSGQYVVPAGNWRLSMSYFPATYYMKESCTVSAPACVTAPDGTTTLKRYEIRPANYATTAEYDAAIQNFANWYTFYRKRKLMLNAAMGQVLEPLTGLKVGVIHFNARPAAGTRVSMYDLDDPLDSQNGRKVAGIFYETDRAGGTPTRETLKRIGDEYMDTAGPIKYSCQRNNAFILTDGFANVSAVNPPSYTKSTWGTGAPYETTYDDSLANLALGYYTLNLRTDLTAGKVAPTKVDTNTNPHMNTYGLTIGSRGLLFVDETTPWPTLATDWTNPVLPRHPSSVDDLWHATINGRGQMYLATTPTETADRIQKAMTDILSATGAAGGIAVSTVNLSRGDSRAYFGTYNPAGWAGDLTGNPIDAATGVVDITPVWSASAKLGARAWGTRMIASSVGGAGVGFTAAAVGATVNPGGVYGSDAEVMDYLRGDRTHEGTKFRARTSLLGAIINSEPAVSREEGVVYVQSGEGMLHAFDIRDPNAGEELWAFVPNSVLGKIGETSQRGYTFRTQLDGSPVIAKSGASSKLLVAGTGVAGRSFHALDVTNPRAGSEGAVASKFKWEFPAAGDTTTAAKVGMAIGRPLVVKTTDDGYVALLTSGYNSTADGKGRLWMVNVSTGAIIHEFTVADGSLLTGESGLAQVAGFTEADGTVRYVFGGDLLGNLWRFDLKAKSVPFKLAQLRDAAGVAQPVTAAPELLLKDGQRIVIVGTGRLLDITDFGSTKVQSIYAISDGATLSNARLSLVQQTYVRATDTVSTNPVNWASARGWYLDLTAGEQINTRPTIAYGAIAFVSNVNGGTDCSASSYLYVLDVLTGSKYAGTTFTSTLISNSANSSAVTALRTVSGKIVGSGQDADGKPWQRNIANALPILPSKNSWREIRR